MHPAFVLHRWPYQDTSLLVELFSPEYGRFRVIAKGAKRPRNAWRSILQPFVPLIVATRGRHELQTLISAEASAAAIPLSGSNLYSGFYLNELIQRLTSPSG
jgi:DNA repair protein RecO (recombination protein O)